MRFEHSVCRGSYVTKACIHKVDMPLLEIWNIKRFAAMACEFDNIISIRSFHRPDKCIRYVANLLT